MKLYGYYRSSASYRIRIVLNLKSIDWEYVAVALDKGQQHETDHVSRNPMKLVPVLDTGSELLAQSIAIAEYLETQVPEPPLLPRDAVELAQVREMQHIISSETQPLANLRVLKHLRSEYGQDDAGVDKWCRKWIGRGFDAFENRAAGHSSNGQYSYGDSFTLADAWLIPQVYNANRFGLDLEPYPTIRSVVEHCSGIEAVAAAHPSQQPDAPATL
jgi:maleylacetoacetate isomerase